MSSTPGSENEKSDEKSNEKENSRQESVVHAGNSPGEAEGIGIPRARCTGPLWVDSIPAVTREWPGQQDLQSATVSGTRSGREPVYTPIPGSSGG